MTTRTPTNARTQKHLKRFQNGLMAATVALVAGAHFATVSNVPQQQGPVLTRAIEIATGKPAVDSAAGEPEEAHGTVAVETNHALAALSGQVHQLSRPEALEDAFRSYYAYKAAHPDQVRKPYLYFVDYGLSSTTARGYFFDMDKLSIVEGPFTVAHGRGSSSAATGVPTRFANVSGAATTSLGLYVAQELYGFVGHMAGTTYSSTGLRLNGVSKGFNDMARARGVVAHGAPYVTATRAGRSQGCPAMEPARAARLLPKLSQGGMVFLFAPDSKWLAGDQWIAAGSNQG